MRPLNSLGIKVDNSTVYILNQRSLPDEEVWMDGSDPAQMVEHIRLLRVRGAPLIGVCAALSLAWFAENGGTHDALHAAAEALRAARPTAVNLGWAMDRLLAVLDRPEGGVTELVTEAVAIFEEDVALCDAIAKHGQEILQDGEAVLTHCNTGALATAGVGTALGILRRAYELGRKIHVFATETRPLLQGGRLTAWECTRLGIPCTLITDSMAAALMAQGRIQRVLLGADRIAVNGDFANKIGTYNLAVAAHYHQVPFHTAAPWSTVDMSCRNGAGIPIEQREPHEVRGASGSFGSVRWAPAQVPVDNPAFDVTPVELVTSIVLDTGVYPQADLRHGCLLSAGSASLVHS